MFDGRSSPDAGATMTSFLRIVFMGLFLFGCVNVALCVRALADPTPGVPTVDLIAVSRRLQDAPSSVTSQEVAEAMSDWEAANRSRKKGLWVLLSVQLLFVVAVGRKLNQMHEAS